MNEPTQVQLRHMFLYDKNKGELHRYRWLYDVITGAPKLYCCSKSSKRKPNRRLVWFRGFPYLEKRMIWIWHNGEIPAGAQICYVNVAAGGNKIQNLLLKEGV